MTQSLDFAGLFSSQGIVINSMQILDILPDGITIQDRNFTVVYQNHAMLAAFGSQVGNKCYAAYEKRDAICEGCGVAKAFQSGQPVLVLRTAIQADGRTSYWENSCFPIFDDWGEIIAGAEVCRNISDRVGLEDEVKQRNIELGQLNTRLHQQTVQLTETLQRLENEVRQREQTEVNLRHAQKLQAVGQLAAGIAHEINTPTQFVGDNLRFLMDSFNGILRLLAEYRRALAEVPASLEKESFVRQLQATESETDLPYLQENVPSALSQAVDGISRITSIVRAMKDFAHPDRRDKSPADLNRALRSTLTIARNEYKYVADIETDFGDLPSVVCHFGDMNQVFLNLLVNAAHAIGDVVGKSGSGGRGLIGVRTRREGEFVRIDISDTGCGIPEDARERIFEPFFTTKEVGRGSGQGLAIARSIVEVMHGGTLTFESQIGKGTTFTIRLPICGQLEDSSEPGKPPVS
ncbi:MAG: ATP-binding protein [candidate division FCPU426 bacterium]